MLELRDLYRGVAVHATEDDEHEAALELLLLVVVADGRIQADEIDAVEQMTDDLEWNSPTFSFNAAFGPAMAKVRAARLDPDGIGPLLDEIDGRIASRVLRAELLAACREIADVDRARAAEETLVLGAIEMRFGHSDPGTAEPTV